MKDKPNIYITGCHRSGSSWIGKMLAASGDYLVRDEEIFNCAAEIANSPIKYMYTHICRDNGDKYYSYVRDLVDNKYNATGALKNAHSLRDVARVAKRKARSVKRWMAGNRPQIFVEPIGLFSTEWFNERFDVKTIVVIRHPASFISSLKRLDWGFDFTDIANQETLMREYLHEFREELRTPPKRPDIIGMGILQWRMFYSMVSKLREKRPEWIYVRQEDLAVDPINAFGKLYERVGLSYTEDVKRIIEIHTSASNPTEFKGGYDDSRRDSRSTIKIWKKRLSSEEVGRIREGVKQVSDEFYDEDSWR